MPFYVARRGKGPDREHYVVASREYAWGALAEEAACSLARQGEAPPLVIRTPLARRRRGSTIRVKDAAVVAEGRETR